MAEFPIDVRVNTGQAQRLIALVQGSLGRLATAADRTASTVGGLGPTLRNITTAASVRQLQVYADTWVNLENRLRQVTDTSGELVAVQEQLFTISQETRTSFESTANLYARLGLAAERTGTSTEDLLRVTRTLSQAVQVGGSTARESANGLIQLAQGIASNRLQGDELRSVLENLIGVSSALEEGLTEVFGRIIDRGDIRELAAQGELTSDRLIQAFLIAGDSVDRRFQDVNINISQGFQRVGNSALRATGTIGELTGATSGVAGLLTDASVGIDSFTDSAIASELQIEAFIIGINNLRGSISGLVDSLNVDTGLGGNLFDDLSEFLELSVRSTPQFRNLFGIIEGLTQSGVLVQQRRAELESALRGAATASPGTTDFTAAAPPEIDPAFQARIERSIISQERLNAVRRDGAIAVAALTARIRIENQLNREGVDLNSEAARAIIARAEAAAVNQAQIAESIRLEQERQREEEQAISQSIASARRLAANLNRIEREREAARGDFSRQARILATSETDVVIEELREQADAAIRAGADRVEVERVTQAEIGRLREEQSRTSLENSDRFADGVILAFERVSEQVGSTADATADVFTSAFNTIEDVALGSFDNIGQAAEEFLGDLASAILRTQVLAPLASGLGNAATSLFSGGGGVNFSETAGTAVRAAQGGVFGGGSIHSLSGGVYGKTTGFNFAGARKFQQGGVLGEQPGRFEGVFPLTQLPNGELGIQTTGGGGGITINQGNIIIQADGDISERTQQYVIAQVRQGQRESVNETIRTLARTPRLRQQALGSGGA